ncbi:hypothetical protein RZS08_06100 [Arthrospira platensis SPKY1]|jgi:hypothetical protein|nr:hypothetical protein [Arthrospira platensis SPKY1]
MNNYGYLGIVESGRFEPLATEYPNVSHSLRLTTLSLQAAQSPESEEISLIPYEGSAILVRGVDSNNWIYSAIVVEKAGQILTAVVRHTFDLSKREDHYHLPSRLS